MATPSITSVPRLLVSSLSAPHKFSHDRREQVEFLTFFVPATPNKPDMMRKISTRGKSMHKAHTMTQQQELSERKALLPLRLDHCTG
jgi:hypothetical protein